MTTKKIKISELKRFDPADFMECEQDVIHYLDAVLEDGDPALLAAALGNVARARGMMQLARDTGLSRESLYKGLSGNSVPTTDTLLKVIHALGLQLKVTRAATA